MLHQSVREDGKLQLHAFSVAYREEEEHKSGRWAITQRPLCTLSTTLLFGKGAGPAVRDAARATPTTYRTTTITVDARPGVSSTRLGGCPFRGVREQPCCCDLQHTPGRRKAQRPRRLIYVGGHAYLLLCRMGESSYCEYVIGSLYPDDAKTTMFVFANQSSCHRVILGVYAALGSAAVSILMSSKVALKAPPAVAPKRSRSAAVAQAPAGGRRERPAECRAVVGQICFQDRVTASALPLMDY